MQCTWRCSLSLATDGHSISIESVWYVGSFCRSSRLCISVSLSVSLCVCVCVLVSEHTVVHEAPLFFFAFANFYAPEIFILNCCGGRSFGRWVRAQCISAPVCVWLVHACGWTTFLSLVTFPFPLPPLRPSVVFQTPPPLIACCMGALRFFCY